jgi:hypothetical protein
MTDKNETFRNISDPNDIASEFQEMFTEGSIQAALPKADESAAFWKKMDQLEGKQ